MDRDAEAIAAAEKAAADIEWWCPPAYLRTAVKAALRAHEMTLCQKWRAVKADSFNVDRDRT